MSKEDYVIFDKYDRFISIHDIDGSIYCASASKISV